MGGIGREADSAGIIVVRGFANSVLYRRVLFFVNPGEQIDASACICYSLEGKQAVDCRKLPAGAATARFWVSTLTGCERP